MYIGEKKISNLKSFLDGFGYAQEIYEIRDDIDKPNLGMFHDWVAVYYGWLVGNQINSTAGWHNIILAECHGEESVAIDVFFELYDKFQQEGLNALSQFKTSS